MVQKDKSLLLQDLSARLPYGVMIEGLEHPEVMTIKHLAIISVMSAEPYRPYLRPMSSMTEEETFRYNHLDLLDYSNNGFEIPNFRSIDWLNAHHFDYRGLIEKGLALEAPKDMYNKNFVTMSWYYYPDNFSSYEEYVKYLKEKGFAFEAP